MPVSRQVERRLERHRALTAAMDVNVQDVSAALRAAYEPFVQEGEVFDADAVAFFTTLVQRRAAHDAAHMEQADNAAALELAQDGTRRTARDGAAGAASDLLRDLKEGVSAYYGDGFLASMPIRGRTPRRPSELLRHMTVLVEWLGDASTTFPERPSSFMPGLDKASIEQEAEPVRSRLAETLTALAADEGETKAALAEKNAAIDAYDDSERILTALMRIILVAGGLPDRADAIRVPARA